MAISILPQGWLAEGERWVAGVVRTLPGQGLSGATLRATPGLLGMGQVGFSPREHSSH